MNRLIRCSLLFFLGLSCKDRPQTEITIVDKAFVQSEIIGKQVQLVDVRTREEYESGHIDDALNFNVIDHATFLRQIKALDKDQPVYLYCKMGGRSNRASQVLKEQGFTKIFDYSGGYNDWVLD